MTKLVNAVRNYRNELFGLSIFTIMIFHFFEDVNNAKLGGALTAAAKGYTLLIGSAGVEVFLFLSGMGLYYSLSRSPKILAFYKKRLVRVLPAYIILGGAGWLALDVFIKRSGFRAFAADFSTLSFWLKGERLVWYISLILILYLLFPLLFKILSINKKPLAAAVLCSIVLALLIGIIALKYAAPDFYKHTEIALWRVFPFILGSYYQRDVGSNSASARRSSIGTVFTVLCVLGILLKIGGIFAGGADFPLSLLKLRLNNLLYPIVLMLAATGLLILISSEKLNRPLKWLGSISLELYLSHVIIRRIFKTIGFPTHVFWVYCVYIAISFAVAIGVHYLLGKIFPSKN